MLDLWYLSKNKKWDEEDCLWSISDAEQIRLSKCFQIYERRTGYIIDPYGDLEITGNSLVPLLDSIDEAIQNETDKETLHNLGKLYSIVEKASSKGKGIEFVGD